MNEILTLTDIQKSYGTKKVLHNLSFTMKQGETVGLLGPNGAGKTTTLDLILGIKQPDKGTIKLYDKTPKQFPKTIYNNIGVQFQHSFYPEYITVKEVCQMTSCLYPDTIPYTELLKQFKLADKESQKVASLSGGEKQKLAVLLALINKPNIVFLDELTTGLDPEARRDVWDILKNLQKQGLSILLTSHYMDEVEQLCDKIIIINHGAIIFEGTTKTLKETINAKTLEDAYLTLIKEEQHA